MTDNQLIDRDKNPTILSRPAPEDVIHGILTRNYWASGFNPVGTAPREIFKHFGKPKNALAEIELRKKLERAYLREDLDFVRLAKEVAGWVV